MNEQNETPVVADGWQPLGYVDRDDAIVFPQIPDPMDEWPVRTTGAFTIRFTALEDVMSGVLRSVGESIHAAWAPFRDALDYVLFGMTARTAERSARKTANARRNRLRRKRARRRRRRG